MQRLSWKRDGPKFVRAIHITSLSDKRVAAEPRLQANLIALPRFQPPFGQRRRRESFERFVPADRVLAFWIARMRLFLNQRFLIPHEPVAPEAGRRRRMSVDDCAIHPLDRVSLELLAQRVLSRRCLREYDQARGVAIDAMHDERFALTLWSKIGDQLIDDRIGARLALERNSEQAGGLVEHEDRVVFEKNPEITGADRRTAARAARSIHPRAHAIARA